MLAISVFAGPLAAQEQASTTIPVPRQTIYPGDVISDGVLLQQTLRSAKWSPGSVHTSRATLVGRVARRTLIPGYPVPIEAVRLPYAVQQGQIVVLDLALEGLHISAQGEAMQAGGVGEVVNIRNLDSGTIVRARVRDERTATVEER